MENGISSQSYTRLTSLLVYHFSIWRETYFSYPMYSLYWKRNEVVIIVWAYDNTNIVVIIIWTYDNTNIVGWAVLVTIPNLHDWFHQMFLKHKNNSRIHNEMKWEFYDRGDRLVVLSSTGRCTWKRIRRKTTPILFYTYHHYLNTYASSKTKQNFSPYFCISSSVHFEAFAFFLFFLISIFVRFHYLKRERRPRL